MDPLKKQLTDSSLVRLVDIMQELRKLDYEVPAQVILCFVFIASHNPCHSEVLCHELGLTRAAVSRNTDWLSKKHRLTNPVTKTKKPGLNLIKKEVDPSNRRRMLLSLTVKGKSIAKDLRKILDGN